MSELPPFRTRPVCPACATDYDLKKMGKAEMVWAHGSPYFWWWRGPCSSAYVAFSGLHLHYRCEVCDWEWITDVAPQPAVKMVTSTPERKAELRDALAALCRTCLNRGYRMSNGRKVACTCEHGEVYRREARLKQGVLEKSEPPRPEPALLSATPAVKTDIPVPAGLRDQVDKVLGRLPECPPQGLPVTPAPELKTNERVVK